MRNPAPYEMRQAAADALREFQKTSEELRRAQIWAFPMEGKDGPKNVTEHVVSLLDMIVTSIDWGSGFWSDDDLPSFIELCAMLKVDTSEMPR